MESGECRVGGLKAADTESVEPHVSGPDAPVWAALNLWCLAKRQETSQEDKQEANNRGGMTREDPGGRMSGWPELRQPCGMGSPQRLETELPSSPCCSQDQADKGRGREELMKGRDSSGPLRPSRHLPGKLPPAQRTVIG
ncbi:hypothetical protein Q5P01_021309 [Channa striata]|uniref:Uncharacterized protein n=1 Tax=Channa striata TaxID=64152 RepID=A0AA88LU09_CHASR|nr:hypothetical protein Q5P01_021309 [Channa striata]